MKFSSAAEPQNRFWLDIAGLGLSTLCAVHCFLMPFLASALAGGSFLAENHFVHAGIIILTAPVAFTAFYTGHAVHGKKWVYFFGVIGVSLLAAGLIVGEENHFAEKALAISGGGVLFAGHVLNARLKKNCC